MKTYCDYCGKEIGEAGKIYIAGTICHGHTITIWQWLEWKVRRIFDFL